ncbi:DUF2911 domain-containing protein [Chondrinema litorale]|uniref:DUF2911 domain-containing protein n=1 Tax=Chondrinema litorale TaxID=2994555 RepID=UPI002543790A|nr:DUF2911 domain-containing protein [Chondrinema litorale]UZR92313.1 DUF2911 domain-containing protein [Chondrinema litorale]
MKKIIQFYALSLISLSVIFSSCSKTETTTASSDENSDTTTAVAEEPAKEEIPSPLKKVSGEVDGVQVNMQYGSPGVKERNIWGDLVPYNEVWRTGANEATWIEFDKDVTIAGQKIPKGKYGLFTIPAESEWTVILNKVWDQWGAYDYDEKEDLARFNVVPQKSGSAKERMEFSVDDDVTFAWENLTFSFDIEPATEG